MTEPVDRKILTPERLADRLREERAAARRIVQCHGCFDIVHPGHVRYLRFARELGDILVVSLTGDDGVNKGPDRPYIPQELRAENLAALEFVDWVVIDPHPTAAELLDLIQPDVYVKGREYAQTADPRFLREREIVERHGGRVVFHSGDVVFSSTRLLEGMIGDRALDEDRLRTFCERSQINRNTVREALGRFDGMRAIVIGDLIRERYVFCDAGAMAEHAPVMALRRLGVREYWGGAAATALQLRALGAHTSLLTAVSDNAAGRRATRRLTEAGLVVNAIRSRPSVVARSTFVADDDKLFEMTDGESVPLDSTGERAWRDWLEPRLAEVDLLLWCDHGFGGVSPGLVQAVGESARAAGVTVAGHAPRSRSQLEKLTRTDLLITTERRLREAMHDMETSLPAIVYRLLAASRGRTALVSLRKRGVIGFDGRGTPTESVTATGVAERLRSDFVPALARHYVDWLGTDEAVLSTAAMVLAGDNSLALSAYIAAAAEAIAVSRPGGKPVGAGELQAWLGSRPELRPQSRFLPDAATAGDIALLAPPLTSGVPHE